MILALIAVLVQDSLTKTWSRELEGGGDRRHAVADAKAVVVMESDTMAMSAKDGTVLWRVSPEDLTENPIIANGFLVAEFRSPDDKQHVHRVSMDGGRVSRMETLKAGERTDDFESDGEYLAYTVNFRTIRTCLLTNPEKRTEWATGWASYRLSKERLYYTDPDRRIRCGNLKTGETVWTTEKKVWYSDVLSVNEKEIVVLESFGRVAGLDPATGKEVWTGSQILEKMTENTYDVMLDANRIVVRIGGSRGAMVGIDRFTGKKLWSRKFDNGERRDAYYKTPVLDGAIALWDGRKAVLVDIATGKDRATAEIDVEIQALAGCGTRLYVVSDDRVDAFDWKKK
jgi:outer membrane protein assembly factor BamB